MSNFPEDVRDSLIGKKGRKRYRDLYNKQLAERVAEHEVLAEAFKDTVRTMNGLSQLASQQVKQITSLSDQIAKMKAEEPDENGETSEETEVRGE